MTATVLGQHGAAENREEEQKQEEEEGKTICLMKTAPVVWRQGCEFNPTELTVNALFEETFRIFY